MEVKISEPDARHQPRNITSISFDNHAQLASPTPQPIYNLTSRPVFLSISHHHATSHFIFVRLVHGISPNIIYQLVVTPTEHPLLVNFFHRAPIQQSVTGTLLGELLAVFASSATIAS